MTLLGRKNKNQISAEKIEKSLATLGVKDLPEVIYFYTIPSTNTEAKSRQDTGRRTLFIADSQTGGRGRLGRSFQSPSGCGLYMSLLLYPELSLSDGGYLTALAAVAVCSVIEEMTPLRPKIKWVNDIYIGEKKLCGILTEGSALPFSDKMKYAVVGIGLNVTRGVREGVESIATDIESECGMRLDRCELAARITAKILELSEENNRNTVLEEYRKRCFLIGRRVRVVTPTDEYVATVLGIGESFELLVERADGERVSLITGEVTLRLDC